MSNKQQQKDKWEIVQSSQIEPTFQESPVQQNQNTSIDDWERLQGDDLKEFRSSIPNLQEEKIDNKGEWEFVKQTQGESVVVDQEVIVENTADSLRYVGPSSDVQTFVSDVKKQIRGAMSFVRSFPGKIVKMIKSAKGSEIGVVFAGVVAGGLFVSLLALSNRTYFWKQRAHRVYGDMVSLLKKTEEQAGVVSFKKHPVIHQTFQAASVTTDFA
eukprot:TRINITY_DN2429_c0_g1_i10.p1 TRINITY_DN2429_c0_g1~~TRINITY_DN2429_c0_g1_i10.p1  ORF type:complete len:214 (+),score=30.30 TRINITY_DN2429_c0_g1_i10:102-743(+)